jgi:hypothetical protein
MTSSVPWRTAVADMNGNMTKYESSDGISQRSASMETNRALA